jgi:hypothetical protein
MSLTEANAGHADMAFREIKEVHQSSYNLQVKHATRSEAFAIAISFAKTIVDASW